MSSEPEAEEQVMRTMVIEIDGKRLFLLNGLVACERKSRRVEVEAVAQLIEAIRRNPDAVAFGRVWGRWVAAA